MFSKFTFIIYFAFSRQLEVSEPSLKEKWKLTVANIKSEIDSVLQL